MLHTSARQVSTCVLGLIKAGARPRGRVYTVSDRLPYVTTCEMHSMCHGTAFLPWFCYQQKTEARIGEPHLTEYLLVSTGAWIHTFAPQTPESMLAPSWGAAWSLPQANQRGNHWLHYLL